MNRYLDTPTALVAAANLALILAAVFIPGLLAVLGGVSIVAVLLVSLLWWGDRTAMMADRVRWGQPEKTDDQDG